VIGLLDQRGRADGDVAEAEVVVDDDADNVGLKGWMLSMTCVALDEEDDEDVDGEGISSWMSLRVVELGIVLGVVLGAPCFSSPKDTSLLKVGLLGLESSKGVLSIGKLNGFLSIKGGSGTGRGSLGRFDSNAEDTRLEAEVAEEKS